MKPWSLIVLAAGMGSRYGGLKQIDAFGPNGEFLIEYGIYDAFQNGCNHVVFITSPNVEAALKANLLPKLSHRIKVDFVEQSLQQQMHDLSKIPKNRLKPWGTAHAVLIAKHLVTSPFAVMNADDFYGHQAFATLGQFIQASTKKKLYGLVTYTLKNTLSDYGAISRGVCNINEVEQNIVYIQEIEGIRMNADKKIQYPGGILTGNEQVSMNLWSFDPSVFDFFDAEFQVFINNLKDPLKEEFFLPKVLNTLIQNKSITVQVLPTHAEWFGVTHAAEKAIVQEKLRHLHQENVYPKQLWPR